jgi:hypothetical protein
MPDYLVKLYELPDPGKVLPRLREAGVTVRRPMAYEKHAVTGWVLRHFSPGWASECEMAFSGHPITCHIATRAGEILGFSCYDCTCRGFFGPIGVREDARRSGVGKGLLLATLDAMARAGYGYAVVGGAASVDFYARSVGAWEIPGSSPGVYTDRLGPRP